MDQVCIAFPSFSLFTGETVVLTEKVNILKVRLWTKMAFVLDQKLVQNPTLNLVQNLNFKNCLSFSQILLFEIL